MTTDQWTQVLEVAIPLAIALTAWLKARMVSKILKTHLLNDHATISNETTKKMGEM